MKFEIYKVKFVSWDGISYVFCVLVICGFDLFGLDYFGLSDFYVVVFFYFKIMFGYNKL